MVVHIYESATAQIEARTPHLHESRPSPVPKPLRERKVIIGNIWGREPLWLQPHDIIHPSFLTPAYPIVTGSSQAIVLRIVRSWSIRFASFSPVLTDSHSETQFPNDGNDEFIISQVVRVSINVDHLLCKSFLIHCLWNIITINQADRIHNWIKVQTIVLIKHLELGEY